MAESIFILTFLYWSRPLWNLLVLTLILPSGAIRLQLLLLHSSLQMSEENCYEAGWCCSQSVQSGSGLSPRSATIGYVWFWEGPLTSSASRGGTHCIQRYAGTRYWVCLLLQLCPVISCWSLKMSHRGSIYTTETGKWYMQLRVFCWFIFCFTSTPLTISQLSDKDQLR